MKIVFIVNAFPPAIDGVGDYSFNLIKELCKVGYQIDVYCKETEKITNALPGSRFFPIIKSWDRKGMKGLLQKLNEAPPDWIILQYVPYSFQKWGMPFRLIPFLIQCRFAYRVKVMITFHELANGKGLRNPKYFIPAISQFGIGYSLALTANSVITSNKVVNKELRVAGKKRTIIPIGSNFSIEPKMRYELINPYSITIVSFGFSFSRNYYLYDIAEELNNQGYSINWIIMGKTESQLQKKLYIKGDINIQFTGVIDDHQVNVLMSQADIFLLQEDVNIRGIGGISTKSGISIAAFSSAFPILATKGNLTDETYFRHLENCYLVNNNVPEIINGLKELIADGDLREGIGRGAHDTFLKHFNWETVGNRYSRIINRTNFNGK